MIGRLVFAVSDDASSQEVAELEHRLNRFNFERSGIDDARDLSIMLRTPDGELFAGLHGYSWGGYCAIGMLWVAEERRGQGIGSHLIAAAEAEAIARGCDRIILSTHSFQAPGFYHRHGFHIVAEIADCPRGFSHLTLVKCIGRKRQAE